MSQKEDSNAYFSEPEEVLNWKDIPDGAPDGAQIKTAKRKRNSHPKSFPKSEKRGGRRRKQRDNLVDEMELCAKRMKFMSLQNVPSPKTKEENPFEIDTGYEGDCEA